MIDLTDRIILPLDVPTMAAADAILTRVGTAVNFYKVGYQLLPVGGSALADRLSREGKRVFLDFKFLDIGATVERGVASARQLNADFITVHAEHDALKGALAGRGEDTRLKILAVTVLTSWDQHSLRRYGLSIALEDLVLRRAALALELGVDGVVASAQEAAAIRARFGQELTIVTPGVRPQDAQRDDQKRAVTPAQAIKAGADYLVIGRPILTADDPLDAVLRIQKQIAQALGQGAK